MVGNRNSSAYRGMFLNVKKQQKVKYGIILGRLWLKGLAKAIGQTQDGNE